MGGLNGRISLVSCGRCFVRVWECGTCIEVYSIAMAFRASMSAALWSVDVDI